MANQLDPQAFPRGAWQDDWSGRDDGVDDLDGVDGVDALGEAYPCGANDAADGTDTPAARALQLSARLPCCIFELECEVGGGARFSFLGANSLAVCGVAWECLKEDPDALAECVDMAHREGFQRSFQAALAHDAAWNWEGPLQSAQSPQSPRWLQIRAEPRGTEPGTRRRVWAGILQDVTLRRASEAALERALADMNEATSKERLRTQALRDTCARLAERNRTLEAQSVGWERHEKSTALARLALGLAHEINNPLAGVTYMFEALQSGTLPSDRRGDYARSVEAGLQRIQSTTHSLLQYAHPPPPCMGPCAWPAVVAAAKVRLQSALASRNLQLVTQWGRGGKTKGAVRGDPKLLEDALTHVLLNAVHASRPGARIELALQRADGHLGLVVCDHGPGIPAEYVGCVCDPFFTTKQQGEGTGLGLATASRMLEVQRGRLEIDSVEGEGTRVTLWALV